MKAKKERKYFPAIYTAQISHRVPDKWTEMRKEKYFDTWAECHTFSVDAAVAKLKRAEADFKSAQRHLTRVKAMTEPTPNPTTTRQLNESGEMKGD